MIGARWRLVTRFTLSEALAWPVFPAFERCYEWPAGISLGAFTEIIHVYNIQALLQRAQMWVNLKRPAEMERAASSAVLQKRGLLQSVRALRMAGQAAGCLLQCPL